MMSPQTVFPTTPPLSDSNSQEDLQEQIERLSIFIRLALRESYSNHASEEALQLLDRAWKAQKSLWQLRQTVESSIVKNSFDAKSSKPATLNAA